ncbi:isoleucine--tRNA ligase, chloroplastic/mitochondrial [Panicum miliaceum]|uniref:isoleucine--tRNA ligase n=1 Tax=Panicum miliaceum TaxID=4540 RepID=A0A3L6QID2_PANMI|nr:isoleucine--tRNA ligase, chloroplastic/mitochondrial [Panicum miliaceum]
MDAASCCRVFSTQRCRFPLRRLAAPPWSQPFCTESSGGLSAASISKRRSRGPVMAAKKAEQGAKQEDGKYKHTVDLPKTTFGLRANSVVREPELQKLWEENQVLKRVSERNSGATFVLHDGPPYANGDLHMGHALNKILKDIINRYKLLQNHKVSFVPGWDCHGLPIELKVLKSMDKETLGALTPIKLRQKAAKFAKATVDAQMKSFKRYGVWADWSNPYLTLSPEYEAAQLEVFGQMVMKGYIYRGRKPVHWSPSSRTALAEAELEYSENHVSRSIYAAFKITNPSKSGMLDEFLPNVSLVIWTTTPWTIPANAAVAVNPELAYAVAEVGSVLSSEKGKLFVIVASDLVTTLESKWGVKLVVQKSFPGSALEHCRYVHPVNGNECSVVLGGDYITTESGTGLVHTAPGHGQEDYITGLKYGLPIISPVDDEGNFTAEAGQFSGLSVLGAGNAAVVKYLDEQYSLILEEPYKHKYPYDWRSKEPTIFRATEQWFASVDGFRNAAMDAIRQVAWVPSQYFPMHFAVSLESSGLRDEAIVSKKGSDAWWYMTTEELLPDKYRDKASEYRKGTDTMDVWFDSGSSWAAVLAKRDGLKFPADIYLEGSDQHRGWFQSSLLTSIATTGKAPYSSVITHGFVLDEKGFKMSKSIGNVVDPVKLIDGGKNQREEPAYGADVLRLWVSSVDYTGDVLIGPQILRQMSDMYRKLRGTMRFLLSNLHDWKLDNSVPYSDLPKIDKYALFQLETVVASMKDSYENYQFFKVYQMLQRFAIVGLSNFYLDVAKDRLYVGGRVSFTRKSCQTVLTAHLLYLVRAIAPIMPHLAEDVWQNLPFQYTLQDGSVAKFVFDLKWPEKNEEWLSVPKDDIDFLDIILELRSEVNKILENARTGKLIGSSLDAKVYIHAESSDTALKLKELSSASNDADALHHLFITSQVEVLATLNEETTSSVSYTGKFSDPRTGDIWIGVTRADGAKCERCWNYTRDVGSFHDHPTLCARCYGVIDLQPQPAAAAVS